MKLNIPTAIAAFVLTLLVFSPAEVFFGNVTQIKQGLGGLILTGLLLAAIVGAVLSVLARAVVHVTGGWAADRIAALFMSMALSALLQGTYLGWEFGALDGSELDWSRSPIKVFAALAIWFLPIVVPQIVEGLRAPGFVNSVSFILILMQTALFTINFSITERYDAYKAYSPDRSALMEFSRDKNIILLVVDEYQCDFFAEVLERYPDIERSFDGFTNFVNAVAPASQTFPSVPAIMTARLYDNSVPTPVYVEDSYTKNSLPQSLRAAGIRSELYQAINGTVLMSPEVADNAVPRSYSLPLSLQVIRIGILRASPVWAKRWILERQARQKREARALDPNARNKARSAVISTHPWDMWSFRDQIADAVVDDKPPTFKFIHLEGTHVPIRFNANLEPVDVGYTRDSVLEQAAGVARLISEYLNKMKSLGVYEDAIIYIIGDHGSGRSEEMWLNPSDPADATFNQIKARGCPLFLAKASGAGAPGVNLSTAPVSSIDVPASILDDLELPPLIELPRPDGASSPRPIFSILETETRVRTYYSYVWERFDALYLPPMTGFIIEGNVRDDASWRPGPVLQPQQ